MMLSKLRDEQQKKAKEQADEKDREKEELRAMYREDTLLRVLKYIQRPKTASKAAIKTPHTNAGKNVPRSFADIVTEAANITKPTEDMVAKKKAFNEEAAKKFRETLQQRIKAKKQQDLLIQKEKANEELKKREKVSSVSNTDLFWTTDI